MELNSILPSNNHGGSLDQAARITDLEARAAAVRDLIVQFRGPCAASDMRTLLRLAQGFARGRRVALELALAIGEENAAAAWLRGCLKEALADHEGAAAVFGVHADSASGEEGALFQLAWARNLAKSGRISEGWRPLARAAGWAATNRTLSAIDEQIATCRKQQTPPARRVCRIALLGTVTLDFWAPALRARSFAAGIDAEIYIAPFQQYRQEILSPESGLKAFRPDVVILATDWRSLHLPDEVGAADAEQVVRAKVADLEELWRTCREQTGATVIQPNFEIPESDPYGRLSVSRPGGRGRLLHRINLELWEAEQRQPGVAIFDLEQAASIYGKQRWNDPVLWHAARQYPAADAVPFLTKRLTALLRALFGLTAKCVVLDLDNTLWGGVIGEDGLNGIRLGGGAEGEAYAAFQTYLKSLQKRGILLAVCSKNNPEDARAVFREHPETVLKLEDFSIFVANWQPKEENLRQIAATLNLGLDSLVLVDDNHAERLRIRQMLPEVETPELPADPARYIEALDRTLSFEALTLTEQDYKRAEAYRENAVRQALQASSANVEEFLANLQMHVELRPFDEANLPRIVQLINKTNQFNLTTRRRTQAAVGALMASGGCYTQSMRLRDRFGDNGITGVLIACEREGLLYIDTWLISCRVLGRSVEDAMIASVAAYARRRNLRHIQGEYIPTAKNGQVKRVYERFGFTCIREEGDGGMVFQFEVGARGPETPAFLTVEDHTQEQVT
jgi:FkbH-like protein